jgi:glutamine synthetase
MPTLSAYEERLAHTICEKRSVCADIDCSVECENLKLLSTASKHLYELVNSLDDAVCEAQKTDGLFECAKLYHDKVLYIMKNIRNIADEAETITASELWPYPTYGDLLFKI